jgi:hypothetical protein
MDWIDKMPDVIQIPEGWSLVWSLSGRFVGREKMKGQSICQTRLMKRGLPVMRYELDERSRIMEVASRVVWAARFPGSRH